MKEGRGPARTKAKQPSGRVRETALSFAGARLEHKATGDWAGFGPLSFSSKLAGTADGGWAPLFPMHNAIRKVTGLC